MSKKLQSGLILKGISPNILLHQVENTAPFIFLGEIPLTPFLEKIVFYKKNLNLLKNLNLYEYFYLCLSAHWATAGTFVPTDVDNQIREGLWRHEVVGKYIQEMTKLTIEAWKWDYTHVTNRKSFGENGELVLSTHEGTWLSVAIGAYCALVKNKFLDLSQKIKEVILEEIKKEEMLLIQFKENKDYLNFLRTSALVAHNLGDLDRVIDQWKMDSDDPMRSLIYKLGHEKNQNFPSNIFVYSGEVNKKFLSLENHRHMSMRQPRGLRKSHDFLIPVGPFMEDWGRVIGRSTLLNEFEKAEILVAFMEGFKRQDQALGYVRALRGMIEVMPQGLNHLAKELPFNVFTDMKASKLSPLLEVSQEVFESNYQKLLSEFVCPKTNMRF